MSIIAGYMVPHPPIAVAEIGRGEEKAIQPTIDSYREVARDIASLKPDTIILTSPHSVMYSDYLHISPGKRAKGDFGQFRAPDVRFEETYDKELVERLADKCALLGFPAGTAGARNPDLDHGTMVPLYFVEKEYKDFKLVRVSLSGLPLKDHYRLGMLIRETAAELSRRAVFIGSGDLSHCQRESGPYGYKPEGPRYDDRIMDVMGRGDFGELFDFDGNFLEKAEECGHRSFVIMAGAFDRRAVSVKKLSHESTFGVGYGFCIYHPEGEDESRNFLEKFEEKEEKRLSEQRAKEDAYVQLARKTVESYIRYRKVPEVPEDLPEEMYRTSAGTFVSIHKDGALRGCIGTISAICDNVAEEIIRNAISASTRDPRFLEIEPKELPYLEITVDVLGDTEPIASKDLLDVKRYGVIVTNGMRRGLLLPNLDGVDTVDEQIDIARRKAGIRPEEEVELERFEVVRHY
ncbi:MAG: AmmeMemoRadiSam system protein A [Lachnospiraceae bacterium]|nr:AmmeMemoRadiSam system protein A [Lachnospiraceae bacterium]